MTLTPGRPFWAAFTAFTSNLVALVTVAAADVTHLALTVSWGAAVTVSLLVALAVYGKEKLAEARQDESRRL